VYTQGSNFASKAEFNDMRETVFSGQIGIGYDIALVSPNDRSQVNLSPFISYQPYFGQEPRSSKSWAVSTLRVGVGIKFGSGAVISRSEPAVVERDVQFSVRAPKAVPAKRRVRETFPLRNYVFFEAGSTEIPNRYVALTKDQAASFKEEQLQEVQPINMTGRSLRQMTVYYNILNILGDRMKRNPGTVISLSGASEKGPEHGKARAETIKRYLVEVFGIEDSRITTEGRDKPRIPSETPGGTKELALLRAGDRRVDIESNSPEMMIQVGGGPHYMLKPVQIVAVVEDPLDSQVLFDVFGAKEVLASWSLEITDEQGKVQRFGPSTREHENISGNTILGDRSQGDYKVVMLGETKRGKFVRKENSIHLVRRDEPLKEAVRFSILFDFDKSKTIASYEKFLTDIVTPLIPDSGIVIIHGHTDIVGEEEYNNNLSIERAQDAQNIIEHAISNSDKRGITFETFGFGENLQYAPFENYFPEERFYNRTVIIDIVPD
jgi:outer membrane protein OmpA-like peptidoglycan-associated protein